MIIKFHIYVIIKISVKFPNSFNSITKSNSTQ